MTEKRNDATPARPAGDRVIDAPSLIIDLPAFIAQIRQEDTWKKNDRNSITVFKTDDMCIVLGGLHMNAEMRPHKTEGITSIQVLEGMLEINTDELTGILQSGQLVAIHKGRNYRVVAMEESIYLLTISDVSGPTQ